MEKLQKKRGTGKAKAILKQLNPATPVQTLLAKEEGFDVEIKRSVSGLDNEDLVAFANSTHGGTILIGVEEKKDEKGRQVSIVVGCAVGDHEKRKILDKAQGCVPTVSLSVTEEQIENKTIYRISIPSGPDKPYCTSGGTYKIRGDGRNLPLQPNTLLDMFLDEHGKKFFERFRDATIGLRQTIENTSQRMKMSVQTAVGKISADVQLLDDAVSKIEERMGEAVEQIAAVNTSAEASTELTEQVSGLIEELHKKIEDIEQDRTPSVLREMIDALLTNAGLEDPVFVRDRNAVKAMAAYLLNKEEKDYARNPQSLAQAILYHRNPYYSGHVIEWVREAMAAPMTMEEAARLDPACIGLLVRNLEDIRRDSEVAKAVRQDSPSVPASSASIRRTRTKRPPLSN